jgi:hypothetical protein
MIELKEGVPESPDSKRREDIKRVLTTPQGLSDQMARKAFEGFDYRVDEAYKAYRASRHPYIFPPEYDVEGDDVDENYEPGTICVLDINHLQLWPESGDFTYNGGNTKVKIRLTTEGKIEYEFSGDEMVEDKFLKEIIEKLIKEIAEGL